MHTATEILNPGSLSGGLTQWVTDMWRLATGSREAAPHYPLLEDAEFTHALIGLSAKLVGVDGNPTSSEYAAFRSLFPVREAGEAKLRSMFMKAMNEGAPALQYARQIKAMHPQATALHREVLDRLLKVATADAALNAAEHELLNAVAQIFEISGDEFRGMASGHVRPVKGSAYALLGVTKKMTDEQIRERYMAQVRQLHPDRYQAAGASDETIAMLSDKLATINAAYESIMRARDEKRKK